MYVSLENLKMIFIIILIYLNKDLPEFAYIIYTEKLCFQKIKLKCRLINTKIEVLQYYISIIVLVLYQQYSISIVLQYISIIVFFKMMIITILSEMLETFVRNHLSQQFMANIY